MGNTGYMVGYQSSLIPTQGWQESDTVRPGPVDCGMSESGTTKSGTTESVTAESGTATVGMVVLGTGG